MYINLKCKLLYTGGQFAQVNMFELLPAILNISVVKIAATKLFP